MSSKLSKRRMAENEVVFRKYNEQIQKNLDKLQKVAVEEGDQVIEIDEDMPLHFYCECADENCRKRILINPKIYNNIHAARNRFTVVPGHEVPEIEEVTETKSTYYVVTKYDVPRQTVTTLSHTAVDNS